MRFKAVKCNLCGENKAKTLTRCKIEKVDCDLPIDKMSIVRCPNCGFVYVNPHPEYSPEEFRALYSEKYFDAPYMRFYIEEEGEQTNESFMSRLDWIEESGGKGRILDIGCASGGFLRLARDKGWDSYGIELSKAAADIAREKYGLNVVAGKLDDAGFDDAFFDAVTVGDVLEHVEDPKSFLFEINRIMKNRGLLYIGVPDFDGLYYKAAVLFSRLNHRNYFVLPHHICFFNRDSVSQYLKRSNFKLMDFRKSEANISTRGFSGKIMRVLFFVARLMNKQDRILFLAQKQEDLHSGDHVCNGRKG